MAEHIEIFSASNPRRIISYGLPYEDAIAKHLQATLKRQRPYLLVSGTLSRTTDVVERLTARLRQDGIEVAGICKGIRPHTLYADLLPIMADIRATKADAMVIVGGGSLVDGAKVIAFGLANDADSIESLDRLVTSDKNNDFKPSTIPYMCATTTLSAGEYSPFGGATNDNTREKRLFHDPSPDAGHRVIVLDPRLTLTAPPNVWISTGMRAVDHCVETACALNTSPEALASALQGLRQLIPALLRSKKDPNDLDARLQAQLGTGYSMKGLVLLGAVLGGSHGIGHQLGPQGVPHAETTCVLLPAVLKFNASINSDKQAVVLATLWDSPDVAKVLEQDFKLDRATADLSDAMDAIIRALDLPRTLSHYGIGRDKLDIIASHSLSDWMCQTNPIPLVKKEQVLEILEQCL